MRGTASNDDRTLTQEKELALYDVKHTVIYLTGHRRVLVGVALCTAPYSRRRMPAGMIYPSAGCGNPARRRHHTGQVRGMSSGIRMVVASLPRIHSYHQTGEHHGTCTDANEGKAKVRITGRTGRNRALDCGPRESQKNVQ